jgi:hypothetical protein
MKNAIAAFAFLPCVLTACAPFAPSRVNESMYVSVSSKAYEPKTFTDMENCVYFAFFDNRFGDFQVRREDTHTGKRINMQSGTYDLLSADVTKGGKVEILKYWSAPSVPWVQRLITQTEACAAKHS